MMDSSPIAERKIHFKKLSSGESGVLLVKVYKPYLLQPGIVDFSFAPGTAGCSLKFEGLDTTIYDQEVYGADSIQSLQLASDIDGMLKIIAKDFDLSFPSGEPYFE